MNKKVIVSWSGGKDCNFALYKAVKEGFTPVALLTTMPSGEHYTYGHGFSHELLKKQAEALQIPIEIAIVSTPDYRSFYVDLLKKYKTQHDIEGVIFGDLYLQVHRDWIEDVCKEADVNPHFPLWIKPDQAYDLLLEFIDLGFKCMIVKTNKRFLDKEWTGTFIDKKFAEFAKGKICPMGESGEFHTLVIDGPLFSHPLSVNVETIIEEEKEYKAIVN